MSHFTQYPRKNVGIAHISCLSGAILPEEGGNAMIWIQHPKYGLLMPFVTYLFLQFWEEACFGAPIASKSAGES